MKNINAKVILGSMMILGTFASCATETAMEDKQNTLTTNISDAVSYSDYAGFANNNDGFNYMLDDSYSSYNGTNSYMTDRRMDYVKQGMNDQSNYNDTLNTVDYRNRGEARRYNNNLVENNMNNTTDNLNNYNESNKNYFDNEANTDITNQNTYTNTDMGDNTGYNMLLEDVTMEERASQNAYDMTEDNLLEAVNNGKVENNKLINNDDMQGFNRTTNRVTNNVENMANRTMDNVQNFSEEAMQDINEATYDVADETNRLYNTTRNKLDTTINL